MEGLLFRKVLFLPLPHVTSQDLRPRWPGPRSLAPSGAVPPSRLSSMKADREMRAKSQTFDRETRRQKPCASPATYGFKMHSTPTQGCLK